jgi:MGT family glycosyltransferase
MDPQRFVFVGPSIQPRLDNSQFPLEQLKGQTVLYISLGTVMNNQADFYNLCFRAFRDEPWQVVLSMGTQVDPAALDPIPANFIVRPSVPQLEVLQHTRLFVTHCGMNSTMESLYFAVPMVGLPQQGEQMMTGRRIQELGLGTALDMNTLTVEQLHATVKAAMSNADYRKNAQAMQQYVRNAGGYPRAADAILNFAQSHRPATT